jgi:hypothetical protein
MTTIEVLKPFRFAERGVHVIEIAAGVQDVTDEIAEVAIEAGWARYCSAPVAPVVAEKPARKVANKARTRVPEVG